MIEKMLSLSTCHMPSSNADLYDEKLPSFKPREVTHQYGRIVFVSSMVCCSEWFKPIMRMAHANNCTVILFDSACPKVDSFKTYDW